MAPHGNLIPNPTNPNAPFIDVNLSQCKELTPITYFNRKTQLSNILFGYDLLKFVDGTHTPPPPATITNETTKTTTPNPALHAWQRQDRLILGALMGTLPTGIASLLTNATTSREAWLILANTYANPSRGHILQVKDALDSFSKGNLPISDYMTQLKTYTDKLAALGKPMDAEDIIAKVLRGLDTSYQPVIEAIRARDTTISFDSLHEKLINHELTIKQSIPSPPITTVVPRPDHLAGQPPPPPPLPDPLPLSPYLSSRIISIAKAEAY
ncbi:hypothetical protein KSS87_002120 [Heliosperma pusillum]|nr:hypothetical protein KSS87_002120 [Heliosperma pusillum]